MPTRDLATALHRAQAALQRRPEAGLHDDTSASARWRGGTRVVTSHPNSMQIVTDMPSELGGSGDQVSPGWLFRAGFASCTATVIAMTAAAKGIELESLEVLASSRTDTRGMLGMTGADGAPVNAGPRDMELLIRIRARGVSAQQLRALADEGCRHSPVACALRDPMKVALHIEVDAEVSAA